MITASSDGGVATAGRDLSARLSTGRPVYTAPFAIFV